jgi:hypothetical protein
MVMRSFQGLGNSEKSIAIVQVIFLDAGLRCQGDTIFTFIRAIKL